MWGVVCAVVAALAAQGAEASWSPDALLNHASGMREKVFQTQVVGGQATGPGRLTFMASLSLPPATSKYHVSPEGWEGTRHGRDIREQTLLPEQTGPLTCVCVVCLQ